MSDPLPPAGSSDHTGTTESSDTTDRTLRRTGAGRYRTLVGGPGEPHRIRRDLLAVHGDPTPWPDPVLADEPGRRLASLVHLTDFQIADLVSPSRVEFLQRLDGVPVWQRMLPALRPQEFLLDHAVETIVRTVRRVVAGDPDGVDLVVTTGDNTDSAQLNELDRYLTLMNGGRVRPGHGELGSTVTASGDPEYWNPEPAPNDRWKSERGLPALAGVLAEAGREFEAHGLGVPWLTCFGNHDCLVQGRAAAPAGYDAFLTGDRKPVAPADGPWPDRDALELYCEDPTRFSGGPGIAIEPRAARRLVSKQEWVEQHFRTTGLPRGHGFTQENRRDATTYYAHDDIPGVRVIGLDTTNPAGHVDGRLDRRQTAWLAARLAEVHSTHLDDTGSPVTTGREDRLVILCSHHGLSTLTNDHGADADAERPALADEVEALLHRFPNVALWLSGHTHVNRITPRPAPGGGGFWEVSTSSVAEWPVQLRRLVLNLVPDRGVVIRSTMVDSDAPATPVPFEGDDPVARLAALHREVAANDPGSVGGPDAEGDPADRNVLLLVPLPGSTVHALQGRQVAGAR